MYLHGAPPQWERGGWGALGLEGDVIVVVVAVVVVAVEVVDVEVEVAEVDSCRSSCSL